MRRFLPALAALLLLLSLCACTKPSEEPTPSPAPPAEETQNPKSTKRIAVSPATGDGRQLIFDCPADWESDGYNDIDYRGRKLIEVYYTPAEEQRGYMQKWDDIQIKQLGEREFYISSAEYGILEDPEMTPGVEEEKVCLYTIWSYYFFDGEDSYGIALFENQEREQVISVEDFEEILANLEVKKPPENIETKKLAVTVNPNGEEQRLILECPADWETEYGCITYEGRLLVDFYADTAESIQNSYLQGHDDIQTKRLGEREFQTYMEEYMGKETVPGESEARRVPYQSWSYYFAEDGIGYLIRLEQSKEREEVISITDFEKILARLEIEAPLGTTENAVGYEKMTLGKISLWLPEGTVYRENTIYEDNSDLARRISTVEGFEAIEDKDAPFAVYDEKYSDAHWVEEHEFGGYASKSYHRQIEVTDTAIPGFINLTGYCIDVGDEMLVITFYKMRVGGYSPIAQDDDFVKVLNSIEVG